MISIIIPTLNEEDYLPALLASIKKQNVKDYEIIVSDAGSKDKTLEIAKQFGCIITKGGLPATGRNNGAKVARGDILFFLDADNTLPDHFLAKSLHEFKARKLGVAGFTFKSHSKNKLFHMMLAFSNKMVIALEEVLPFATFGVLVKSDIFRKVDGYDEDIKLGEDQHFVRRAAKHGKFGILRSSKLYASDRRFVKDGWFTISLKYSLSEAHTLLIGPVKSDIFKYKFNHYKDGNPKSKASNPK